MRRPTYSEIYMYRSLFWLSVAVFVFFPIVNNVVLQLLYWSSSVNVAYYFMKVPIGVVQEILSFITVYAGLAVLVICVLYFGRNAKGIIRLAFASHAVNFITYVTALFFWSGVSISYIIEAVVVALPDAVVMLVIYLILLRYGETKNTFMNISEYRFDVSVKKHTYTIGFAISVGITAIVKIAVEAYGMIVYYVDPKNYYSRPSGIGDILSLALQYVYILLIATAGFVTMVLIGFAAQRLKDSGKKKRTLLQNSEKQNG